MPLNFFRDTRKEPPALRVWYRPLSAGWFEGFALSSPKAWQGQTTLEQRHMAALLAQDGPFSFGAASLAWGGPVYLSLIFALNLLKVSIRKILSIFYIDKNYHMTKLKHAVMHSFLI